MMQPDTDLNVVQCPHCGIEVYDTAPACPRCGTKISVENPADMKRVRHAPFDEHLGRVRRSEDEPDPDPDPTSE